MHASAQPQTNPQIVSIQVGRPKMYGREDADDPMDRPWTTGFFKEPVAVPLRATPLGLEGDGQADLSVHGGVDKAILAYSADHYPAWCAELAQPEMPYGAFGENLSVTGLAEPNVCIGDTWQAGDTWLQVSQPRQPCWKMARRWRMKQLPKLVIQTGRSGWYFRVLQEGTLSRGLSLHLAERPHPQWTIERANDAMYGKADRVTLVELAALGELADAWKSGLF